jgi:hypothetical protein
VVDLVLEVFSGANWGDQTSYARADRQNVLNEINESDNEASVVTTVYNHDLQVTVIDSTDPVGLPGSYSYTITINNDSQGPVAFDFSVAGGLLLRPSANEGAGGAGASGRAIINSIVTSQGACAFGGGGGRPGRFYCTPGSLSPGPAMTIQVNVTVLSGSGPVTVSLDATLYRTTATTNGAADGILSVQGTTNAPERANPAGGFWTNAPNGNTSDPLLLNGRDVEFTLTQ